MLLRTVHFKRFVVVLLAVLLYVSTSTSFVSFGVDAATCNVTCGMSINASHRATYQNQALVLLVANSSSTLLPATPSSTVMNQCFIRVSDLTFQTITLVELDTSLPFSFEFENVTVLNHANFTFAPATLGGSLEIFAVASFSFNQCTFPDQQLLISGGRSTSSRRSVNLSVTNCVFKISSSKYDVGKIVLNSVASAESIIIINNTLESRCGGIGIASIAGTVRGNIIIENNSVLVVGSSSSRGFPLSVADIGDMLGGNLTIRSNNLTLTRNVPSAARFVMAVLSLQKIFSILITKNSVRLEEGSSNEFLVRKGINVNDVYSAVGGIEITHNDVYVESQIVSAVNMYNIFGDGVGESSTADRNQTYEQRRSFVTISNNNIVCNTSMPDARSMSAVIIGYARTALGPTGIYSADISPFGHLKYLLIEKNNLVMFGYRVLAYDPLHDGPVTTGENTLFRSIGVSFLRIGFINKIFVKGNVFNTSLDTEKCLQTNVLLMANALTCDVTMTVDYIDEIHVVENELFFSGPVALTGGLALTPKGIVGDLQLVNFSYNRIDMTDLLLVEEAMTLALPLFGQLIPPLSKKPSLLALAWQCSTKVFILQNNSCFFPEPRLELFTPFHAMLMLSDFTESLPIEEIYFVNNHLEMVPSQSDAERLRRITPDSLLKYKNKLPGGPSDGSTKYYLSGSVGLVWLGPVVNEGALKNFVIQGNRVVGAAAQMCKVFLVSAQDIGLNMSSSSSSCAVSISNNLVEFKNIALSASVTSPTTTSFGVYCAAKVTVIRQGFLGTQPDIVFEFKQHPSYDLAVFDRWWIAADSSQTNQQIHFVNSVIKLEGNSVRVGYQLSPTTASLSSTKSSSASSVLPALPSCSFFNISVPDVQRYTLGRSVLLARNFGRLTGCGRISLAKFVVDDAATTSFSEPLTFEAKANVVQIHFISDIQQPGNQHVATFAEFVLLSKQMATPKSVNVSLHGNVFIANFSDNSSGGSRSFLSNAEASPITFVPAESASSRVLLLARLVRSINISASPICNQIFSEKVTAKSFSSPRTVLGPSASSLPAIIAVIDDGCNAPRTRTQSFDGVDFPSKKRSLSSQLGPPPAELPGKVRSAIAVADASQSAAVIALAFSSAVVPALGFSVARQQGMMSFARNAAYGDCRGLLPATAASADGGMDGAAPTMPTADSPTRLSIGSSRARFYAGAVIGNFVFVFGLVFVSQVVAHLVRRYFVRDLEHWNKPIYVFATSHISLLMFFVMALLISPSVRASLVVAAGVPNDEVGVAAKVGLVAIAMILVGVDTVFICWSVVWRRPMREIFRLFPEDGEKEKQENKAKKIPKKQEHEETVRGKENAKYGEENEIPKKSDISAWSRFVRYWFKPAGVWELPRRPPRKIEGKRIPATKRKCTDPEQIRQQQDEDEDEDDKHRQKEVVQFLAAEPCFESYRAAKWFAIVEIACAVLVALPSFFAQFAPDGRTSCIVEGILLLTFLLAYFVLLIWKNPFKLRMLRWIVPFTTLQQLLLVVATLVSVFGTLSAPSEENTSSESRGAQWLWDIILVPVISETIMSFLALLASVSPILKFVKKLSGRMAKVKAMKVEGVNHNSASDGERDSRHHRHHHQHHYFRDFSRRTSNNNSNNNKRYLDKDDDDDLQEELMLQSSPTTRHNHDSASSSDRDRRSPTSPRQHRVTSPTNVRELMTISGNSSRSRHHHHHQGDESTSFDDDDHRLLRYRQNRRPVSQSQSHSASLTYHHHRNDRSNDKTMVKTHGRPSPVNTSPKPREREDHSSDNDDHRRYGQAQQHRPRPVHVTPSQPRRRAGGDQHVYRTREENENEEENRGYRSSGRANSQRPVVHRATPSLSQSNSNGRHRPSSRTRHYSSTHHEL